ncbi:MAG: hypothetical protein WBE34_05480 [Candidatus Nitrosopolaris sp.]
MLYLVFADKALTGYALSLNYNSDTMEALDKGDLSKAVLCYTVEKGKPTDEFGRDSIDMLMKVG